MALAQQAPAPAPTAAPSAPAAPLAAPETPAESSPADGPSAADELADVFSKIGDQIYQDCIFELSQEQVDVQNALIQAYLEKGASSAVARRLAATQIQPPKLSEKCEQIRRQPGAVQQPWVTTLAVPKKPAVAAAKPKPEPAAAAPVNFAGRTGLPQWDCGPNVDYVTIHINGTARKLTGGEICNPYADVVHEVPAHVPPFRLGYTIRTGRMWVLAEGSPANGQTIAWAISGRDVCRNNPDPDCLATRGLGSLPPGEYAFGGDKGQRVTWGPRTKRMVVGVYLKTLWNRERFTPQQTAGILARGNIAIHVRLKGEMSEACLGLEPKGWAYVSALVNEGRATGLSVYIDEPHPQIAEAPPLVVGSSFSLTSLFK